jgi:hypothetical protein
MLQPSLVQLASVSELSYDDLRAVLRFWPRVNSQKETAETPPTAIKNAVIPLIVAPPVPAIGKRSRFVHCESRLGPAGHLSTKEARSFIDRSSEIWKLAFTLYRRLIRCRLLHGKGEAMKKTLMALAAVVTLAVSAVAVPAPAHAQRGVAAGVAAGLIGGAIVGGAIASQNGYYYGPGYGPGYGYYGGPAYVEGPPCVLQRQRFWDGYGWRVRNVRVCD